MDVCRAVERRSLGRLGSQGIGFMVQMGGDDGLAVAMCVIECQSEHLLHNRELTDAAIGRITPEGLSGAEEAVTRWQRSPAAARAREAALLWPPAVPDRRGGGCSHFRWNPDRLRRCRVAPGEAPTRADPSAPTRADHACAGAGSITVRVNGRRERHGVNGQAATGYLGPPRAVRARVPGHGVLRWLRYGIGRCRRDTARCTRHPDSRAGGI